MTSDDIDALLAQMDRVMQARRKHNFLQRDAQIAAEKAFLALADLIAHETDLQTILNRATLPQDATAQEITA